jgi:hypothetical protein
MELDPARLSESSTAGQFVNLSAREGEALRPPGCTDFPVGPSSQPRPIHKEPCYIELD